MTYLYPLARGVGWKSQRFRTNPNNGVNPSGGHTGDDWAVPVGTPLYAPGNGIVRNSGWLTDNYRDNGWWLTRMGGDTLVLDMTDSFMRSDGLPAFIFAHCSDTMPEVGEFVRKGQLVALSGNTGTATTGPHVHIEALPPIWDFNNGVYGRVDPEDYFDEYVDDYQGGIAAQGTIPPLEEDMPITQSDANLIADTILGRQWQPHPSAVLGELLNEYRGHTLDLVRVVGDIPATVLDTVVNGVAGDRLTLRQFLAEYRSHIIQITSGIAAEAAAGGASVEEIQKAVADGLSAGVHVDATVTVGGK